MSGASDEWFAARVFISARRFAYEHQFGIRIADAEHGLSASASEVRAFFANCDAGSNRREQRLFVRRRLRALFRFFGDDLPIQAVQRKARRAWEFFATVANRFQRVQDKIESWVFHAGQTIGSFAPDGKQNTGELCYDQQ